MWRAVSICVAFSCVCLGCFPGATVTKNPGPRDKGIRYYRPKPYLFIQPAASETTTTTTAATPGTASKVAELRKGVSDEFVEIKLQWLPDFSEEYAIRVHSGFGTNDTSITLENGWNLTQINQKLDSQTDENIEAISKLVDSVSGAITKGVTPEDNNTGDATRVVVRATNVPIGFYESVIGVDSCGKKQLYGWKYIGFAPFAGCPVQMLGEEFINCNADCIYGLVFRDGVMRFEEITDIQSEKSKRRAKIKDGTLEEVGSIDEAKADLAISGLPDEM